MTRFEIELPNGNLLCAFTLDVLPMDLVDRINCDVADYDHCEITGDDVVRIQMEELACVQLTNDNDSLLGYYLKLEMESE